jgi:hypothetical protein
MRNFLRENRAELDQIIHDAINKEPDRPDLGEGRPLF